VTLEGLFQGVADGWESAEGENIHCQYPGTIEPRFLPGSLRTGVGRTHFLWFHASRPPWGTGLLGPDKGAPAARPATGLRIRYPSGWEEAIEVSGREEGKGDGSAPAPLDRIRTFDGRGRVLREVRVREDGVTRTDHRYQGLDPRPAETLTEVLALPPGDLSPGAAPRPRAGEAQGASGTAAAEAPRPFFPGLPEGSPRFGIGIKVPGLDAMYGDALDLLKSCGHTMGYLKDEEGAVVGWMSFGPNESLGTANKHRFRFFGVEGDAKWPLSGRMSFWEVPITREQLTTGLEALEHFNAHPPRFSPDMHCTSAVQRLATRMAVPIPTGEGMVVIRGYGVTWYSTQASNPYHLAQALTKTYGPPLVMSAARFVHDFFRHKWGAGRSGGELSSAGP
jgi:hypothetical protein